MAESEKERKIREALEAEAEEATPDDGSERSGLSKIRDKLQREKDGKDD